MLSTTVSKKFLRTLPKQSVFKRNMRLVQFTADGKKGVGVEVDKDGAIVNLCKFESSVPNNMREFLEGGSKMIDIAKRYTRKPFISLFQGKYCSKNCCFLEDQ